MLDANNIHEDIGESNQNVVNKLEVEIIFKLVQLFKAYGLRNTVDQIGVISPFKAQVAAIKQNFTDRIVKGALKRPF